MSYCVLVHPYTMPYTLPITMLYTLSLNHTLQSAQLYALHYTSTPFSMFCPNTIPHFLLPNHDLCSAHTIPYNLPLHYTLQSAPHHNLQSAPTSCPMLRSNTMIMFHATPMIHSLGSDLAAPMSCPHLLCCIPYLSICQAETGEYSIFPSF